MSVNCYPIMYQNKKTLLFKFFYIAPGAANVLRNFRNIRNVKLGKNWKKNLDNFPLNIGRELYRRLYITANGALWRIFIALNINTPSTSIYFL